MKRVTGFGGVLFKTENPTALAAWYRQHLGIDVDDNYGATFVWRAEPGKEIAGQSVWCPLPERTNYLNPSNKPFMFNFRVADLEALLPVLRAEGVQVIEERGMEVSEYGKFAWILDLEGNCIELWEPAPEA